ncbi:hypothetical protein VKT23_015928 [Stygiomarasmius scandens]|uniref:Endo-chitosanase n=1 Tax=Marasmiellus scandens TaxID=2682957 RepID=A0ABR1IWM4_9AGAR
MRCNTLVSFLGLIFMLSEPVDSLPAHSSGTTTHMRLRLNAHRQLRGKAALAGLEHSTLEGLHRIRRDDGDGDDQEGDWNSGEDDGEDDEDDRNFSNDVDPINNIASSSNGQSPFEAASDIDVAGIYAAVQTATSKPLGEFSSAEQSGSGGDEMVTVYGDFMDGDDLSIRAMSFIADMDVDCDGVESCANDPSGQGQTTWGFLNAEQVPFYVLPQSLVFGETDGGFVQPNSLGAIICGGKMFYAIMGDTNGDEVEHIGEASILLAQTCFQNDGLGGNCGHATLDVAYIVFGEVVPPGDKQVTIDIQGLKDLGDNTVRAFQKGLGLRN